MKQFLVFVAVVASARCSWAACNVIPDPKDQLAGGPNPNGAVQALVTKIAEENARFGNAVPYKGALGRIDRLYLSREHGNPLRVAADGLCVPDRRVPQIDLTRGDDLVAALISGDSDGQRHALVAGKLCTTAMVQTMAKQRLQVSCGGGDIGVDTSYPGTLNLNLAYAPSATTGDSARIVVFRASSEAAAESVLNRVATSSCAALCEEGTAIADMAACIDDIFAPTALVANQIVYGAQDMVKCEVRTTTIPWNDFATQCENGDGSMGLPQCVNQATMLNLWADKCHGVYVPFKWGGLLSSGSDKWERQVRGQTVLSQKPHATPGTSEPRLWIPGSEFIGTLAEVDVTGTDPGFVTDPRRAQLDIWFPNDLEFGIVGVADKPQSIVHAVPRLAVNVICSGHANEACMGVPTVPSIDATRCACRDRYAPDCSCETVATAKLFQCSASDMPCTRHSHCNPSELCNKQPTCQPEGTVWKKGGPNPPSSKKCWDDEDCKHQLGAKQCGFLLFDVHDLLEANNNVVLDANLQSSGARKRRGVCKKTGHGNPRKECNNAGGPQCNASQNEGACAEYVLEALGGTKLTSPTPTSSTPLQTPTTTVPSPTPT